MRIISKVKDYYDCIQGSGQDMDLVYLRKEWEDEDFKWQWPVLELQYNSRPVYTRQNIIGFCGKIYPCVQIMMNNEHPSKYNLDFDLDSQMISCYSVEDVDKFFKENFKDEEYEYFKSSKWNYSWRNRWWHALRYSVFEKWFTEIDKIKDNYEDLFTENHSPIFVATSTTVTKYDYLSHEHGKPEKSKMVWNASLKEFEFFKVFEPYSAFQEITMFLGSLASPEKEIPEMTDDVKIGQKGFNEWSFRKPPSKKK